MVVVIVPGCVARIRSAFNARAAHVLLRSGRLFDRRSCGRAECERKDMKAKHSIVIRSINRLPDEYGFNRRQGEEFMCLARDPDELRDVAFVEIVMKWGYQTKGLISTQLTEGERILLNRLE